MDARAICAALRGRWAGSSGSARCPAHEDKSPSLSIAEGEGGRVLVRCHAGCPQDAVIDALKVRGLWANGSDDRPTPAARAPCTTASEPPTQHKEFGVADAIFDYFAPDGSLVMRVLRWDATPERRKEIRPVHHDGARWKWGDPPGLLPLYALPDIAAHADKPVLLVEGEKAADAARELVDVVVSCWPHGARAIAKVDIEPLRGRSVVLWPDADEPGKKAMDAMGARLLGVAGSVRMVALPDGLPKAWDLGDPLPAGLDPDALIAAAVDVRAARLASLNFTSAADLASQDFPEIRWAVPKLIPDGITLFAGKPKIGKSWLALDVAIAVAAGTPALGSLIVEPGDVCYLALEDTQRRLHERIKAVLQGNPAPSRLDFTTSWRTVDAGGLDDLEMWLDAHPSARLIVVDVLGRVREQRPERDKGVWQRDYDAIASLKRVADAHAVAMMVVHHEKKGADAEVFDSISGTLGLTAAADASLVLRREAGTRYATLHGQGRDIPDTELALAFDRDTGKWQALGAAEDWRRTEERNTVLRTLIDAGAPLSPKAIADALGKKPNTVRVMLRRMLKSGEVAMVEDGKYVAAE